MFRVLPMSDDPIEPSMWLLQWREKCCAWNAIIATLFFNIGMFGTRVNGLWSLLFCSRTHHYIGSSQSTIAFSFQCINQLINARKHVKPRVNKCIRCDCWNELNSICYKANHNFQEFLFLSLFFLLWKETQLCQIKTIDPIHKRKWRNLFHVKTLAPPRTNYLSIYLRKIYAAKFRNQQARHISDSFLTSLLKVQGNIPAHLNGWRIVLGRNNKKVCLKLEKHSNLQILRLL